MSLPTQKELVQAACHFGHPKNRWNPKMAQYLYGVRKGIHVFDVEKTEDGLKRVCDTLSKMQKEGKSILFVSTKQQSTPFIEMFHASLSQPIVTKKWIPGLLTNWRTIKQRLKHYLDLKRSFQTGEVEKYTKKEQVRLRKELTKLDIALGGVASMTDKPDAVFVIDAVRDHVAVLEAKKLGIPVYGICDSNANPDEFAICIPGNDDAVKSIALIMNTVFAAMGGSSEKKPKTSGNDEE
ncbi:30S ribosomal protein S2 [Candidatus Peregrinibacteria bacterium]|nr:30S ribosomal protein S2 [Candidatus Peregrinibacteria bacterium]